MQSLMTFSSAMPVGALGCELGSSLADNTKAGSFSRVCLVVFRYKSEVFFHDVTHQRPKLTALCTHR